MRRARLVSLLSLLLALPGCAIEPKGILLITPANLYAPALSSETRPALLEAYTLQGRANMFGQPFANARVSVTVLGKGDVVAEATVAADGTFSVALPAGLPADAVLKVTALKDGQSLTSLAPVPSQLFRDDLMTVAVPKEVLLTADTTVSFRLLIQRLEASGQVSDDGRSNRVAYEAFSKLKDSFSGLINEASDPALQQAVLSADTPKLSDNALAALGNAANAAQHSAFVEAANQMAESLREALQSAGNPAVDSSLLGSLKLGNSNVSPVFPSNSNGRPAPTPTPFSGSAGLTIGAPLPGGFSSPGAGTTMQGIPLYTTYSVGTTPRSLALDALGNAWIANQGSNNVTRVSATGSLSTFTVGTTPKAVAVDAGGNAWVANNGSANVTRISSTGSPSTFPAGTNPQAVTVDAGGNVWVANFGSANVTRISSTGSLSTFTVGTNPNDVAVDAAGNAWVASFGSNNMTRISSTGSLSTFDLGTTACAVAVDAGGNAWLVNQSTNTVTRISSTGSPSTFNVGTSPADVAVDAAGNAWVTNSASNNVTRISSTGSLSTFAVGTTPSAVAVDAGGNAWVTNQGSNSVTRISSTGDLATLTVGTLPCAVVAGAADNAWVVNATSNTATKLAY